MKKLMLKIITLVTLLCPVLHISTSYNMETAQFGDNLYEGVRLMTKRLNNLANHPKTSIQIKEMSQKAITDLEDALKQYTFGKFNNSRIVKAYESLLKKTGIYRIFEWLDILDSKITIKKILIFLCITYALPNIWYKYHRKYKHDQNLKNKNINIKNYHKAISDPLNTNIPINTPFPNPIIDLIKQYDNKEVTINKCYNDKESSIFRNYKIKNKQLNKTILNITPIIFFIKYMLPFIKSAIANPIKFSMLLSMIILHIITNQINFDMHNLTTEKFIILINMICFSLYYVIFPTITIFTKKMHSEYLQNALEDIAKYCQKNEQILL